jgi:hypothetical protein
VMVLLCLALTKDLRHDPLMRRHDRSRRAVEQAVDYGMETYGDRFVLNVKCSPTAEAPVPAKADADDVEEEPPAVARALPRV